jgi:ribosomal protection tetracycline resistance protein
VSRSELNLGILAHVDAGKTTLTERLLYAAGVIDEPGSVDAGTTQTDSLALERRRGITIRSAVASFAIGDVHVNLIDTPGHPDFIAEVERVLSVLDGAVLVLSAVEGVQPQTRILMRALQRLRVPTLLFVNKIDRPGAGDDSVILAVSERLTPAVIAMGTAHRLGTPAASFTPYEAGDHAHRARLAELLAEHDEGILSTYVAGVPFAYARLRVDLAAQTARALVNPVFLGSAATGAGVEQLMDGIAELLPSSTGDPAGPVSAQVFKIERGTRGEKIAYARMFAGTIQTRDRLSLGGDTEGKVTAIEVFERGGTAQRPSVAAGEVAKLWGLAEVRVGDRVGERGEKSAGDHHFPPPSLESVVVPRNPADGARLRVALAQLAEQDPLIGVRQVDARNEISVSLYGEVQGEVIQATLMEDYDLDVTLRESSPICIERPAGIGEAVEILHGASNPYLATIGLRIDPAAPGAGIEVRLAVEHDVVPLYIYGKVEPFAAAMNEYVRAGLATGRFGWQVTDCLVTMTQCLYSVPDGPPSRRGPLSTAADFRKLTPIVVRQALERAGTVVCEPTVRATLEIPTAAIGAVQSSLARLGGTAQSSSPRGALTTIEAVLPAARAQDLRRRLPELTGGEGVLETTFAGYAPVQGEPPRRGSQPPGGARL